ncbi:BTB/POZ domain-containing protein [Candidatus Protochlamydia sp. W-9]|uniref:BTB/POZ domain-containing protein n=1 Tax=Candidatus Protochlamydia sp. W-9 TaxID=1785087 RepID=UPI00096AA13B|nr:BTB/POZ domain-containing protein [Candidatus Protochlamydia sp. W-9]
MQGPDFLPPNLHAYLNLESDRELFQALTKQPLDLIAFFEAGCQDEAWFTKHVGFIQLIIRWTAKSFYLNQLPTYYAEKLAHIIRSHQHQLKPYLLFQPALFLTFKLVIQGQIRIVNSLLLGTISPFFKDLFINYYQQLKDRWEIPKISLNTFNWIESYALKENAEELWQCESHELIAIMQQAQAWRIQGLVRDCAKLLKKYINQENVVENLIKAHRQYFLDWKAVISEVFNSYGYGLKLLPCQSETELRVEFLDFKQETLDFFHQLASFITHLTFSEDLSTSPYYGKCVNACRRLMGADLTGSTIYDNQFDDLPGSLGELNLSVCGWLRPHHIREIGHQFLNLKKLTLDGNVHLNYQSWGELHRLQTLISLSTRQCHQLTNDDLKSICRNCSRLEEFDVEECRLLTDQGILEIFSSCPHLSKFNCNRCDLVTDKGLLEIGVRAHLLSQLSIERCSKLTDQGLFYFLRLKPNLKELSIKGCEFSLTCLEEIRREYPFLKLLD